MPIRGVFGRDGERPGKAEGQGENVEDFGRPLIAVAHSLLSISAPARYTCSLVSAEIESIADRVSGSSAASQSLLIL